MSLLTEEIAYLREDVKDLQQHLAMQQLEIHNLRQVLYYWREECTGFEPSISVFQLKVDDALSTPTTYDDLMAWHEAQLGEPVAWKYTKRDGEITATVNEDFALIVEADGFEVTPLYAKKG